MNQGLGFLGTIAVVLIILKLFNLIAWSWWLVLSPVWMAIIMMLIVMGIILILGKKIKKIGGRNLYKH